MIWATGYRPDYSWIDLPVLDEHGRLRHRRGVTDVPGLFFLGLTWQHTRGSALIGWVGRRRVRRRAGRQRPIARPSTDSDEHRRPRGGDPPGGASLRRSSFELEIRPVKKRIGEATVRMLAYNGSIPGPTLVAPQGATLKVQATNRGDMDATVHWHGLRLENRFDGTHETQAPIPVGEAFGYESSSPIPAPTGTTRISGRTTGRSSACTGTSSSSQRSPATGRRSTGSSCSRSTTSSSRTGRSRRSAGRRRPTSPWALRERHARRRRAAPHADREARRGRAPLPHEHGEHQGLQRHAPGRA